MRPRPRIRKTIKWGGLVVGIALASLLVFTASHALALVMTTGARRTIVIVEGGMLELSHNPIEPERFTSRQTVDFTSGSRLDRSVSWWFGKWRADALICFDVPLWMPTLVSLLSSALAWCLDLLATRCAKLGACSACAYPRAGLAASAPCPECGSAAPSA